MAQLKYYDQETNEWQLISVSENQVYFSQGEYYGKTLAQVIKELKAIASGGFTTRNTCEFHTVDIQEDNKQSVTLPTVINESENAFLVFLNSSILPTNTYQLNSAGTAIIFNEPLKNGDVVYMVIFKTIRALPPDYYDGIVISEGSIQASKLSPALQEKINESVSTDKKTVLENIEYDIDNSRIEIQNANISNLTVQDYNVSDSLRGLKEKPSSNSKSITVSETEPNDPKENDIWIVI